MQFFLQPQLLVALTVVQPQYLILESQKLQTLQKLECLPQQIVLHISLLKEPQLVEVLQMVEQ